MMPKIFLATHGPRALFNAWNTESKAARGAAEASPARQNENMNRCSVLKLQLQVFKLPLKVENPGSGFEGFVQVFNRGGGPKSRCYRILLGPLVSGFLTVSLLGFCFIAQNNAFSQFFRLLMYVRSIDTLIVLNFTVSC